MSAAFQLDYSGPPVRCDFPGCRLNVFHDGEHEIFLPHAVKPTKVYICRECGAQFGIIGETYPSERRTCGKQSCIVAAAAREANEVPLFCPCPQRPYPHELAIHFELRSEAYNPKFKFRWPWSLCLSPRLEPSAERKG